jgi:hypothetical protein
MINKNYAQHHIATVLHETLVKKHIFVPDPNLISTGVEPVQTCVSLVVVASMALATSGTLMGACLPQRFFVDASHQSRTRVRVLVDPAEWENMRFF